MIALVYIGEPRYKEFTRTNHEHMLDLLRQNWPVTVYNFTWDNLDRSACTYELSGQRQVWDFYTALNHIQEDIIVKVRTDIWFGEGAADALLQEVSQIVEQNHDVSFIGAEFFEAYDQTYQRVPVEQVAKVQDFCVVVNRKHIADYNTVMDKLSNGKQFKSGNKTWQFILTEDSRAYTVRGQFYLVRNDQADSEWQIGWDFINQYNKCDEAVTYWILRRPDVTEGKE